MQESLYKAMQLWSFKETPKDPSKWLYRVSYNHVIDALRRDSRSVELNNDILISESQEPFEFDSSLIKDDQLKMMFACVHPKMNENEQIILSLKLLCGFSIKEIAKALFKEKEAIKKTLFRSKIKFKTNVGKLELPSSKDLKTRMDSVLKIIYIIFTKGYTAYEGKDLFQKEVCEDAIRLVQLLNDNSEYGIPKSFALNSLMLFNLSRFEARIDENGKMLTLENQNWSKWDQSLISKGLISLEKSIDENVYSSYHIEASIAYQYVLAVDYESINWEVILSLYGYLYKYKPEPIILLNRIVLIEKTSTAKKAYLEMKKLDEQSYKNNYLYYSIKADLELKLDLPEFKNSGIRAFELTDNQREKEFLLQKFNSI